MRYLLFFILFFACSAPNSKKSHEDPIIIRTDSVTTLLESKIDSIVEEREIDKKVIDSLKNKEESPKTVLFEKIKKIQYVDTKIVFMQIDTQKMFLRIDTSRIKLRVDTQRVIKKIYYDTVTYNVEDLY